MAGLLRKIKKKQTFKVILAIPCSSFFHETRVHLLKCLLSPGEQEGNADSNTGNKPSNTGWLVSVTEISRMFYASLVHGYFSVTG